MEGDQHARHRQAGRSTTVRRRAIQTRVASLHRARPSQGRQQFRDPTPLQPAMLCVPHRQGPGLMAWTNAISSASNSGRSGSRYRPRAPQSWLSRVRNAAIISWSPSKAMLTCHRGLRLGSPFVAWCRVEIRPLTVPHQRWLIDVVGRVFLRCPSGWEFGPGLPGSGW